MIARRSLCGVRFHLSILVLMALAASFPVLIFAAVAPPQTPGSGNALSFDGVDDSVQIPDQASLQITSTISVETWVKTSQSGVTRQIVGKNPAGAAYSYMFALDNLRPSVRLGGTSASTWMMANSAIPAGQWTHIAFTYSGTQLKIYINGVLNRQVAVSGPINKNLGQDVWVGNRADVAGDAFQGTLDEVRIWNRVLTATEIRAGMCRKLSGAETGLVAYYRFDEGGGLSTDDLSTNANIGTLTNGPVWLLSGAPIGDVETNTYASPFSLSFAHPDGDTFFVSAVTGSPAGVHIYRVDAAPNATTPPADYLELDPLRYWGVFVVGGASPRYTATYAYRGHPGYQDESQLRLAERADNAAPAWVDTGSLPDTVAGTLSKTNESGAEYILSSTGALCKELLLHAHANGNDVVLEWTADCTATTYQVFRTTRPQDMLQAVAWDAVADLTDTDFAPAEPEVFYNIQAISTKLTLDWTGDPDPHVCGLYQDDVCDWVNGSEGDGFAFDGFMPMHGIDGLFDAYDDMAENLVISGDPAEFRVKLTCAFCTSPADIAAIDLLVDLDDDGVFSGASEVLSLTEMDSAEDITTGKRYSIFLPALLARDAAGNIRYAKGDGTGTLNYSFRASAGTVVAGGPASYISSFTLWNNAPELIELGKRSVESGACGYDTDWLTARIYFEEGESLLAPGSSPYSPWGGVSPYNQADFPNSHPDYLSALMAASFADTGYTLRNYKTLFQGDPNRLYRDVMTDWIAFTDKQNARMDRLATYASSQPDPSWKLDFPKFCIFTQDGSSPFAAAQSLLPETGAGLPGMGSVLPFSVMLAPEKLTALHAVDGLRTAVPTPAYIFGDNADAMAEWDRADAYLLKALFTSIHATAVTRRVYEAVQADPANNVKVSDLGWIETALRPEADAEAHAKCATKPCPPLNGIDDDGDGLVDDLGFTARVFEMFPGLGVYAPDGGLTLTIAADDSSAIVTDLRQGMRLVLRETDNQVGPVAAGDYADATLVYEPATGSPPAFVDMKSYNGLDTAGNACADPNINCPDGLPDLDYVAGNALPVAWCPADGISHAPPMNIQGGLGDDMQWWLDHAVKFYNKYSGQPPLDKACYPREWGYTVLAADWGYQWQKAVLPVADPNHICFNFRDDVEKLLQNNNINPADLGPDAATILNFLQCIDVRNFIDAPEDLRNYLPYACPAPAAYNDPACADAGTYAINGFYGDWDEPINPIVPGKFWTIEPFSTFTQDDHGLNNNPACDMASINTDPDCVAINWDDLNGNGKYDLFEPILMAGASTPLKWIDLNNGMQWNGWTDQTHQKHVYAGEPAEPGKGLYNGLYIYFQDPTFGGRFPGMSNEHLNNFVGMAAGWADGALAFPSGNHHPTLAAPSVVACTAPGANYCIQASGVDPDGDILHYKLVTPTAWAGGEMLVDGMNTGRYELAVPPGDWGLVLLVYDNVNNLDLAAKYLTVSQ